MVEGNTRTIKTADRIFDIIEGLDELGRAGVTELAEYVDIPKSTLYQYLASLEQRGYVVNNEGTYRLSLRMLGYGTKIRKQMPVYEYSRPHVEKLAEQTGEIAWLIVEERGLCVTLERVVGEQGLKKFGGQIGGRSKLHTHAAGKAILANLPADQVELIINRHGLPGHTDETIQDSDALFEELETIRERGYAFNENETIEGLRAVGSAIMGDDEILGAIAVGGSQSRLKGDYYRDELPELILDTVNEIELQTSVKSPW
jgi:DNA-binding IclR family transcriptional regulator